MKITAANNVKKQEIAKDEYVTEVSRSCKKVERFEVEGIRKKMFEKETVTKNAFQRK
jgi:hypothetical protein